MIVIVIVIVILSARCCDYGLVNTPAYLHTIVPNTMHMALYSLDCTNFDN